MKRIEMGFGVERGWKVEKWKSGKETPYNIRSVIEIESVQLYYSVLCGICQTVLLTITPNKTSDSYHCTVDCH